VSNLSHAELICVGFFLVSTPSGSSDRWTPNAGRDGIVPPILAERAFGTHQPRASVDERQKTRETQ